VLYAKLPWNLCGTTSSTKSGVKKILYRPAV
jgi:hypothetical protein